MKHLMISVALAAVLLASCSKNEQFIPQPVNPTDGAAVSISLSHEITRATDNQSAAESWEKSLSSLSVFAFNNAGKLLVRRDFTTAELSSRSATFALPKSAAGTECSFYAVANFDASSATTKAALTALLEKSPGDYNGTYAEVSTAAKRAGGFVMSGFTTKTVGAINTTTQVGITVKRTVAKIALQTIIAPAFADKYPGSITVNSVKLSRAASQSLLFASTPSTGTMNFTHTQTPTTASGIYNALFYCYETGKLNAGSRTLLEINATYDGDGNVSTTDDRSDVTYAVELTGQAAGEIQRNGYYAITAQITGLVGQDCQVSITVSDWETPVSQSVDLGA